MEILRRVVLLAGLLSALWFAASPQHALVRVRAADFAKEQQRKPKFYDMAKLPLDEFIAQETKDRLVQVAGAEWTTLHRLARGLAAGEKPDAGWLRRANVGSRADAFYFRPDEPPVNDLAGKIGDDHPFTYVAIPSGGETAYLGVTFARPNAASGAPTWLAYPFRQYAVWAFLAALVLYVVIPWPTVGHDTAYYSRLRGSILPDLIGVMLTGVFFVMPLVIVPQISTTGYVLDAEGGWIVLTLIFWAFCLFGLAIFAVAAHYTACQVRILPDRLQRVTLFGSADYPFSEIASVDLGAVTMPPALAKLGFLVSLFNWRAAGPTLLAASRSDPRLAITARDGRSFRLVLTAFRGLGRLLAALKDAGVPMSADVVKLARATQPEAPEDVGRRTRVATVAALVVLALCGAAYRLRSERSAEKPLVEAPDARGPVPTFEQVAEQDRLLREMTVARNAMNEAATKLKSLPAEKADERAVATKAFDDAMSRFEELSKAFDAVGATTSKK